MHIRICGSRTPTCSHDDRVSTRRIFLFVSLIVIAEPLSSTLLLPFVYFMVREMGYTEQQAGLRAGLITSAFFIAQMFAAPLWCMASDKVGRKKVLLAGLFGSAIANIGFGMTRKSLVWAVGIRAVAGMVNGNLAVARTVVGEVAQANDVPKGKAFSVFGFCHAVGWMVGPLVGGTFAQPATQLDFSGPWGVFQVYPWLLPCSIGAVFNVVVCIAALIWFQETRHLTDSQSKDKFTEDEEDDITERSTLVQSNVQPTTTVRPEAEYATFPSSTNGSRSEGMRKPQLYFLLSIALYFIHLICFDELFPLFAASSRQRGTGMSYRSGQIASVLAFAGPSMLIALSVFPRMHAMYGSTMLYRSTSIVFALCYPLFSLAPKVESPVLAKTLLAALVVVRYASLVVGLASFQILFTDLVEPRRLAFMNGIAQSVGSLARAIGPSLGGSVWSWSLGNGFGAPLDFHVCFLMLSLLGAGQGLATLGIPSESTLQQWREGLRDGRVLDRDAYTDDTA